MANWTLKSAPDEIPEQLMPLGSILSTGAGGGSFAVKVDASEEHLTPAKSNAVKAVPMEERLPRSIFG